MVSWLPWQRDDHTALCSAKPFTTLFIIHFSAVRSGREALADSQCLLLIRGREKRVCISRGRVRTYFPKAVRLCGPIIRCGTRSSPGRHSDIQWICSGFDSEQPFLFAKQGRNRMSVFTQGLSWLGVWGEPFSPQDMGLRAVLHRAYAFFNAPHNTLIETSLPSIVRYTRCHPLNWWSMSLSVLSKARHKACWTMGIACSMFHDVPRRCLEVSVFNLESSMLSLNVTFLTHLDGLWSYFLRN